jgi:F-type H+-transporting ATPase subunit b
MIYDLKIKTNLACVLLLLLLSTSAWAVQAEADQAAEIANQQGVFSGSIADALWTIGAFILLMVVLGIFAWKPMLNGLRARQEHIAAQIANAEAARKQAEKTLADYQKRMDEIEARGQQIIKEVTSRAQEEARQLADKARGEAAEIKAKAKDDIEQARAAATEQLWSEVGDMLLALGSQVLGRKITKEDNEKLINDAIVRLKEQQAVTKI